MTVTARRLRHWLDCRMAAVGHTPEELDSTVKLIIKKPRPRRRLDLFRVLCLFILLAAPLSVLYQISVHHFGITPTLVLADLPKLRQP
ncbi:hypothetical protein HUU62_09750 [Rhodoferax sp. 4810]|uniref:Uncharacterized protein n=1 Tax=Thiospirillum jenense TaxID=1653858 RepID=A0A839H960_9GAMM|nr:hypothetical protein [Thiospirillum jenense]MBB1074692.1 hypothetical protein [Rhodoferax jenense]MBB1125464.1 hypothetical protein [Thiospirillum jenense]